jgi:hypothetical protein
MQDQIAVATNVTRTEEGTLVVEHTTPTIQETLSPAEELSLITPLSPEFETLSIEDQFAIAVQETGIAAETMLRLTGWDILNGLFKACASGLNSTQLFVLPVLSDLPNILAKLDDPQAFESSFDALKDDIANMAQALRIASAQHVGKVGIPEEGDLEKVKLLSLEYSKIQTQIEKAVQPLMLALIDTLEEAGIKDLSIGAPEQA